MGNSFTTTVVTSPDISTGASANTTDMSSVSCTSPAEGYINTDEINPNLLSEGESPARDYGDCTIGPRFHREKVRSQIADYCLLSLGSPTIDIELDQQQLSLAVDEALHMWEEWAPASYFEWYHFPVQSGQSIYTLPCDVGMIRSVEYLPPSCNGAQELGGSMPLGWIGDTGYGAGGLAWGAWGYNRYQPYWSYAGEWLMFKQYEDMFERLSSRNGGWEFYEDLNSIKIYPAPMAGGGTVSVHYLQKKKDWKKAEQFMNEYALALCKIMLGRIRSKFSSIVSPGDGITLDGVTLLQEGREEKTQLEKDLIYKWQEPIPIVIG